MRVEVAAIFAPLACVGILSAPLRLAQSDPTPVVVETPTPDNGQRLTDEMVEQFRLEFADTTRRLSQRLEQVSAALKAERARRIVDEEKTARTPKPTVTAAPTPPEPTPTVAPTPKPTAKEGGLLRFFR